MFITSAYGLGENVVQGRNGGRERLGLAAGAYGEIKSIVEELRAAHHLFARHGFAVVDMTDKPIETSAEEIISSISQ